MIWYIAFYLALPVGERDVTTVVVGFLKLSKDSVYIYPTPPSRARYNTGSQSPTSLFGQFGHCRRRWYFYIIERWIYSVLKEFVELVCSS